MQWRWQNKTKQNKNLKEINRTYPTLRKKILNINVQRLRELWENNGRIKWKGVGLKISEKINARKLPRFGNRHKPTYSRNGKQKKIFKKDKHTLAGVAQRTERRPAWRPESCQFGSRSGHMPGLWARSPVGGTWEATTHWCFFLLFLPPFTFL